MLSSVYSFEIKVNSFRILNHVCFCFDDYIDFEVQDMDLLLALNNTTVQVPRVFFSNRHSTLNNMIPCEFFANRPVSLCDCSYISYVKIFSTLQVGPWV